MRQFNFNIYRLSVLFCLFGLMYSLTTQAQLAIGTETPHSSSMLELKSDSLGLLIPRMGSTEVQASNSIDGLLIFDTDNSMMMLYGKSASSINSEWYGLSPWRFRDDISNSTTNVYLEPSIESVNIGSSVPLVGNTLTIENNMSVGTSTDEAPDNGLLLVEDVQMQSNLTVGGTASATEIEAAGIIPIGGVIMWSGNALNLPTGFVLCEGGAPVNGITIPNLSGRFLVGVDDRETTSPTNTTDMTTNYGSVGNTGGLNQVTLDTNQLPVHSHGGFTETDAALGHDHTFTEVHLNQDKELQNDSDDDYRLGTLAADPRVTTAAGGHGHTIYTEGGVTASDNRPKYFALAFIIRVQ